MNDTINRQEAIDGLNSLKKFSLIDSNKYLHGVGVRLKFAVQMLEQLQSAQPEQKTGHWVPIDDEPHEDFECDRCGFVTYATFGPEGVDANLYSYCPGCGARMEE